MITLQIELKDLLFSIKTQQESNCESIIVNNQILLIRNGLKNFLLAISKHFNIAIWSQFDDNTNYELVKFIKQLGVQIIYSRSLKDCKQFPDPCNPDKFVIGKRLKTLNHLGFSPSKIISIEPTVPIKENYNNYFIISQFNGQLDYDLKNATSELIAHKEIQDTTLLN